MCKLCRVESNVSNLPGHLRELLLFLTVLSCFYVCTHASCNDTTDSSVPLISGVCKTDFSQNMDLFECTGQDSRLFSNTKKAIWWPWYWSPLTFSYSHRHIELSLQSRGKKRNHIIIHSFILGKLILVSILYSTVSLELTSCRQVYWTWYGATVSSPLISTLMCMRMAPDTADLSVRLSVCRGGEGGGQGGGGGRERKRQVINELNLRLVYS